MRQDPAPTEVDAVAAEIATAVPSMAADADVEVVSLLAGDPERLTPFVRRALGCPITPDAPTERLRGRPLTEDRVALELGLQVVDTLGAARFVDSPGTVRAAD